MSPEATELTLYLDNEEPLYRQKMYIFRALAKKKDRGKYNPALAPKAFAALMTAAAKKYVREFGATGDRCNLIFSTIDLRHESTDREIAEMTAWFKAHTLEDHGHFRTVEPTIVLEVAFNNVMRSSRHASGFALRFPRIVRIRTDKPVSEIDTLRRVEEIYNAQPDKPAEG